MIIAKNQTNGRGRQTKIWHSCPGNLYCSILLNHNIDFCYLPQLSFVVAISVHKTITSLPSKSANNIKLKWPNDLLINNRKVAGILIESIGISNKHYLVIGIGINIYQNPNNINQLATSLTKENIEVQDASSLLELVIKHFEKTLLLWKSYGFHKIRSHWLKHAYNINQVITVNYQNSKITGIFKGIDTSGRLEILLDSGKIISLNST